MNMGGTVTEEGEGVKPFYTIMALHQLLLRRINNLQVLLGQNGDKIPPIARSCDKDDLRDFSVPKDDPIHNAPNERFLKAAIFAQIARSHVVVIPTGMYSNYSKWIRKEIDGANEWGKPILAVNPWHQQRTSSIVSGAAAETVGWNPKSVIKGIWNLYRT